MRAQYAVDAKIDVGRTPITTEFVTINPIRRHAFRGTPDHSRDPRPAHSAQRRRLTSSIAEHQKTSEGHHVAGAASQNRTVQSACQGIYVEFIFPRRSPSGEAFDEEAPLRTRSDQRSQKRAALSAEAETCLGEKSQGVTMFVRASRQLSQKEHPRFRRLPQQKEDTSEKASPQRLLGRVLTAMRRRSLRADTSP